MHLSEDLLCITQALLLCLIYMHSSLGIMRIYQAKHSCLCYNLHIYVCTYVHTYVCMYVRTYVCMYVCICIYVCYTSKCNCPIVQVCAYTCLPRLLHLLIINLPSLLYLQLVFYTYLVYFPMGYSYLQSTF